MRNSIYHEDNPSEYDQVLALKREAEDLDNRIKIGEANVDALKLTIGNYEQAIEGYKESLATNEADLQVLKDLRSGYKSSEEYTQELFDIRENGGNTTPA